MSHYAAFFLYEDETTKELMIFAHGNEKDIVEKKAKERHDKFSERYSINKYEIFDIESETFIQECVEWLNKTYSFTEEEARKQIRLSMNFLNKALFAALNFFVIKEHN